jgi:hypothetical protein
MQTIDETPQQFNEQPAPAPETAQPQQNPFDASFQANDTSVLETITDPSITRICSITPEPAIILINGLGGSSQVPTQISIALRNQADKYEQKMFHTFSQDNELLLQFLMSTAGRQFDEEGNKIECKWQILSVDFDPKDVETNAVLAGLLRIARDRKYCVILIHHAGVEVDTLSFKPDVVISNDQDGNLLYN